MALTSRNALPGLRRALARRWPDVIKSQGGGANAILARRDRIVSHHVQQLTRTPERRVAHGVLLGCGVWAVNLHATAHDTPAAERDGQAAAEAAREWARGDPIVLGGDFNLRILGGPASRAWPGTTWITCSSPGRSRPAAARRSWTAARSPITRRWPWTCG